ncbi:secreted signaling factor Wnt8 isoform X1 [Hydra vulgaris]|uniref:secreted signaling factor Wnt8 isoform X1 n=1 Tax=Hydra vulgaris TaxID=6087 RepID=UPI001F5E9F25|nr:secreted signaling factor Wnt8 isoform X1 [Hydra vulgaris]XP_047127277.1 secreted signaling factor Wnt8 isoform X1 [Hydra vulgaris]
MDRVFRKRYRATKQYLFLLILSSSMAALQRKLHVTSKKVSPDVVNSVISAYKDAFKNCYKNFKYERWNCPVPQAFSHINTPVSLTYTYPHATKETAYVYAIVAASILNRIVRNCRQGVYQDLTCVKHSINGTQSNQDESFSVNISNALKLVKRIIKIFDYKYVRDEKRKAFNWNNSVIGLKAFTERLTTVCKCHGLSGYCSSKTCWKSSLSSLKETAVELMTLYHGAKKYEEQHQQSDPSTQSTNVMKNFISKDVPNSSVLVYLTESPDYCKKNSSIEVQGTLNRECNHHLDDSCKKLCSSCGYRKHSFVKTIENMQCNCKFRWCCTVVCEKCVSRQISSRCSLSTLR